MDAVDRRRRPPLTIGISCRYLSEIDPTEALVVIELLFRMIRMGAKWKPDWLYELMPFVYLLAGIAAIFHFEGLAGYGAGGLLIIAALLIWKMRIEYRVHKGNRHLTKEKV